jgi:hypothetical protein
MSRPKSCRTKITPVQLIAALVFPSAVSSLISPPSIGGEVSTLLLDQRDGRRRADRDRVGDRPHLVPADERFLGGLGAGDRTFLHALLAVHAEPDHRAREGARAPDSSFPRLFRSEG